MFRQVKSQDVDLSDFTIMGEVSAVPGVVVRRFGQPSPGDGYKISGKFFFVNDRGEAFVLHDWKFTSLYNSESPSPDEFWATAEPLELSVSSGDLPIDEFASWLQNELAIQHGIVEDQSRGGIQVKPAHVGATLCYATEAILANAMPVGYMYRVEPKDANDSGWIFIDVVESEGYCPENLTSCDLDTIGNIDPAIRPFLNAPVGSAFARDPDTANFEEEEFAALISPDDKLDISKPTAIPTSAFAAPGTATIDVPGAPSPTCDECGCTIPPGTGEIRSKTDTVVMGAVGFHRTVHVTLCPECAAKYDGTGSGLMWGMALFVALVVTVALASWCVPWLFR